MILTSEKPRNSTKKINNNDELLKETILESKGDCDSEQRGPWYFKSILFMNGKLPIPFVQKKEKKML